MDGYEMRLHVNSILAVLGEIVALLQESLAEVKGLREDFAERQASSEKHKLVIDSLYNKSYEG